MKSFEERFCVTRPGLLPRIGRDTRLLWFLAGMAWRNLTVGGKVRRRYRACVAKRQRYFVDEAMPAMMPGPKQDGGRQ